ncbi:MAG: hypothetical protein AAB553_02330 [Patescibacteria group bacterium]
MQHKKYLFLGACSLIGLTIITFFFSPGNAFTIASLSVPLIFFFFLCMFNLLFSFLTMLFKRKIYGFLIAASVLIALTFLMNGLTHPIFFILLFGVLCLLLFFVSYQKE